MEMDAFPVTCPYCGEEVEMQIEEDERGKFVQDCEVCNTWPVRVTRSSEGRTSRRPRRVRLVHGRVRQPNADEGGLWLTPLLAE
jgi:hypothetical protein